MPDNSERDAIQRNIAAARDDMRRDIDELDARVKAMKDAAVSKGPIIAAGAAVVGVALFFAPRAIKRLFAKRSARKASDASRSAKRGPAAGSRQKRT